MSNCNIEVRSRNHSCRGYSLSVTHSESVSVALVIQRAMRVRCTILLSVACLAIPYSSALIHKQYDFGGEKKLNVKVVF
jgi:hypothetical protein